jgi:hypothetical protein
MLELHGVLDLIHIHDLLDGGKHTFLANRTNK